MADRVVAHPTLSCPCREQHYAVWHSYNAPPEGEVKFEFSKATYRRDLVQCLLCRHIVSLHEMDMTSLYTGEYVTSTYSGAEGMRRVFEQIVGLPADRSDNQGRVRRINRFAAIHFGAGSDTQAPPDRQLLDIGSGLGVFPHAMKLAGWACTALDPDPRAVAHIKAVAVVSAHAMLFESASPAELGHFDVITFNKVLEHTVAPVQMLAHSKAFLKPRGFVYLELPDEAAKQHGPEREEFFIDHHHVFSPASLAMTAERAGFLLLALERLREPSGKFTLRAFLASDQTPLAP